MPRSPQLPQSPRSPRRRRVVVASALVAGLLGLALLLALDLTLALHRIDRIPVSLKGSGPGSGSSTGTSGADRSGTTYLLVGSDGRARLTDPADAQRYRDANQATGERADVMILLRVRDDGAAQAVSVPRDLWVGTTRRQPNRLGMWLAEGPQQLADSYCADLGIGLDHVVLVDFAAVEALVDAVGGVDVTTETPMRDTKAKLDLPTAGRQHLDGAAAVAWVRSRHPEILKDGRWTPAPTGPDGTDTGTGTRTVHLAEVLRQVSPALTSNPVAAQRALWSVGPHTRTDPAMGLPAWFSLAQALRSTVGAGDLPEVPARHTGGAVPVAFPTPETAPALEPFRSSTCS